MTSRWRGHVAEGQYLTELGEVTQRAGIYDREGREITGGKIYAYYYISEDVGDETENEGRNVGPGR